MKYYGLIQEYEDRRATPMKVALKTFLPFQTSGQAIAHHTGVLAYVAESLGKILQLYPTELWQPTLDYTLVKGFYLLPDLAFSLYEIEDATPLLNQFGTFDW